MKRSIAITNAQSILTYLMVNYPDQISGIENYTFSIEVYIHCNPTNSQAHELKDMLKPILAKGASIEVTYNDKCNIDVLRISYVNFED